MTFAKLDFRILLVVSILIVLSITTYGSMQFGRGISGQDYEDQDGGQDDQDDQDDQDGQDGGQDGGKTIVLYYAPWCGNCKDMMPEWSKFAKKYRRNPKVKVRKVNSDKNPAATQAAKVDRFPTIILYKDGKKHTFTSERRAEAFETFVNSF